MDAYLYSIEHDTLSEISAPSYEEREQADPLPFLLLIATQRRRHTIQLQKNFIFSLRRPPMA